jgi:hypothetical protein
MLVYIIPRHMLYFNTSYNDVLTITSDWCESFEGVLDTCLSIGYIVTHNVLDNSSKEKILDGRFPHRCC